MKPQTTSRPPLGEQPFLPAMYYCQYGGPDHPSNPCPSCTRIRSFEKTGRMMTLTHVQHQLLSKIHENPGIILVAVRDAVAAGQLEARKLLHYERAHDDPEILLWFMTEEGLSYLD